MLPQKDVKTGGTLERVAEEELDAEDEEDEEEDEEEELADESAALE